MLRQLPLSFRHWCREVLRGEWTMTLLSLILAVTAISSIQFITNRIEQGLAEQSAKLLGGNLAIRSTYPIPEKWVKAAKRHQLRSATVTDTQTMLRLNDQFVLVSLQAVSRDYPLFGTQLDIEPKHAMADRRLINQFNLSLPTNIKLGSTEFQLTDYVPADLELSFSSWYLAPRVIIRMADLADTRIIVPGSRAIYRLLLAGNDAEIAAFMNDIQAELTPQQRIMDSKHQRTRLLNNLNLLDQFLQLVILFCILMCGVAITLSMQQYVKKHYKTVALWCFLGAKHAQIRQTYLWQLTFTALLAGCAGTLVGYLLHQTLLAQLTSYFQIQLPEPTVHTYSTGIVSSIVLLFCASFPVFEHLLNVQPLALWRAETDTQKTKLFWPLISLTLFFVFLLWMMSFSLLSFYVLACLLFVTALFIFFIDVVFQFVKRFTANTTGIIKRGMSQITQYPQASGLQIGSFSLVILLMLVIFFMKGNILFKWHDAMKKEAPNYFSFNMRKADVPKMRTILEKYAARSTQFYPMIKGRLTTINGDPILSKTIPNRGHNALHRDLFLTSSMHYPSDNVVIEGSQWTAKDSGKALISVEKVLADAIAAKPGDKLGFMINGKMHEATISNIRTVDWAAMNPNFYVIFADGAFKDMVATYIVSFYLPGDASGLIRDVATSMPNVTVIDMADTMQKIQSWINQAASAVQGLFIFSLLASILVMIAALITTMDERRKNGRLVRLLGGTKKFILKSYCVEFSVVITLCLLIAISGSMLITNAILWAF